jgi:hypothetical protein
MPYRDALRGLKALFLTRTASPAEREALLAREAPGLSPEERATLVAAPGERLDVYVDLLRESQRFMLKFTAPATVAAVVRFAGVPEDEVVRTTLVDTPRRTSRMRELSQRIVDHLTTKGAAWVEACPAILDLARLERTQTETFYAPDDEGALAPPEFAARVGDATVEEVLALEWRPPAALRFVALDHDVVDWRDRWVTTKEWGDVPPRLEEPVEIVCSRDPTSLQPQWSRVEPHLLPLLRADDETTWEPLESLALRWVEATGRDADDEATAGHFFEQVTWWVLHGLLAVRVPPGAPQAPETLDETPSPA